MVSMMEPRAGTWPSGGDGGTAWFTVSAQVSPIRGWALLQRPTANDRLSSRPVLGDCLHRSKLAFGQHRYGVQEGEKTSRLCRVLVYKVELDK